MRALRAPAVLALLAVGISTALVLVSGPAATVQRDVRDGRRDVWAWTPATGGTGRFVPAHGRANVDLSFLTVRHRKRDILVRAGYADLRKEGASYGLSVDFRTDEGVRRHASFVANSGSHWLGRTSLLDQHRASVGCLRKHTHVSYRRDGIWMTFPRKCFDSPRWVQFRALSFRTAPGGRLLVDNPHNEKPLARRWSPRLGRG